MSGGASWLCPRCVPVKIWMLYVLHFDFCPSYSVSFWYLDDFSLRRRWWQVTRCRTSWIWSRWHRPSPTGSTSSWRTVRVSRLDRSSFRPHPRPADPLALRWRLWPSPQAGRTFVCLSGRPDDVALWVIIILLGIHVNGASFFERSVKYRR